MCLSPPYLCAQKTEVFYPSKTLRFLWIVQMAQQVFFYSRFWEALDHAKLSCLVPSYHLTLKRKKHLDEAGTEPRSSRTTSNHSIHNTIGPGHLSNWVPTQKYFLYVSQANPLKLANPMVSCRTYHDCILFQMGGVFGAWSEMHGHLFLLSMVPSQKYF